MINILESKAIPGCGVVVRGETVFLDDAIESELVRQGVAEYVVTDNGPDDPDDRMED